MNSPAYCADLRGQVVVFRTDASLEIGSGHVMRCLTLADALRQRGAKCIFICREHPGNLCDHIESSGFSVHRLPVVKGVHQANAYPSPHALAHAHWLGASWESDAEACRSTLKKLLPAWLVVDHYALDIRWEVAARAEAKGAEPRLFVIDDLADRHHDADLLLDQNLGHGANDYRDLVPDHCQIFTGPQFALLRPEFAHWRETSLTRRADQRSLERLLISLGGVDKGNVTEQVFDALKNCDLPEKVKITVVMGTAAPWQDRIRAQALQLPWSTEVVVNVNDMARRMSEADLAIGAAGSTSWERCCLGLPTLMLVLADNQQPIAEALHNAGAALYLGTPRELHDLASRVATLQVPAALHSMSEAAAQVTTGEGLTALTDAMCNRD